MQHGSIFESGISNTRLGVEDEWSSPVSSVLITALCQIQPECISVTTIANCRELPVCNGCGVAWFENCGQIQCCPLLQVAVIGNNYDMVGPIREGHMNGHCLFMIPDLHVNTVPLMRAVRTGASLCEEKITVCQTEKL